MSGRLEFTVLGCGSSGGVPRADGNWGVCDPTDPRNRRSRCSLLVKRKGGGDQGNETTILIDTSPDLRLQTAGAGATRIDAALLTHDHADQVHGIDDLRAFFIRHRRRVPLFADVDTRATMQARFGYVFHSQGGYPAICDLHPLPEHGAAWSVDGPTGAIPVQSFEVDHGQVSCAGYRFGPVGYAPDVVRMPEQAFRALAGVEVVIIDALRDTPHPTHAHVALTLEWIARLAPRRAILTNMHIDLDFAQLAARLPVGVEPAYDGLRFEAALS